VVALSNNNGNIVEQYSYSVFGTPTIRDAYNSVVSVSSVANRFMFTGREYDTETGNYYYRARYYKPSIGRFISRDPIGYHNSINLYTYVKNDPVDWTDPDGLRRLGCHERCYLKFEVCESKCAAKFYYGGCINVPGFIVCWWNCYGDRNDCHADCGYEI